MTRRASIEIDLGTIHPPDHWTAAWVQARVVEAYCIERRLPGARRFTNSGTWPAVRHEFSDVVGWTDARERVLDSWSRTHGGVFAAEIHRMDEAHEWLRVHLAGFEIERLCLSAWATATAYHRPLAGLLRRKGWSRTTFYRRMGAGALVIAMALDSKGEPVT